MFPLVLSQTRFAGDYRCLAKTRLAGIASHCSLQTGFSVLLPYTCLDSFTGVALLDLLRLSWLALSASTVRRSTPNKTPADEHSADCLLRQKAHDRALLPACRHGEPDWPSR